jgi:hypothetical protein
VKKPTHRSSATPRALSHDHMELTRGGTIGNPEYGDFTVTVGYSHIGNLRASVRE